MEFRTGLEKGLKKLEYGSVQKVVSSELLGLGVIFPASHLVSVFLRQF